MKFILTFFIKNDNINLTKFWWKYEIVYSKPIWGESNF
jgi:hypothetical protein